MTKKNILIISYDWPPKGGVGMLRMVKFAKYLVKFGHNVSVITKDPPGGNVHWDTKEFELKKVKVYKIAVPGEKTFFNNIRERINPQLELGWFCSVNEKLSDLLKDIECDVIISSSPPESAHLIARAIKQKLGKPWIADLRDLWSHDHYRSFGVLRRAILGWEEKDTLKKADRIVTVSEVWAELLRKRYGSKVRVITNSFDEDWYGGNIAAAKDKFRISYLGKLNAHHQDIKPFLNAVSDVINKGSVSRERFEVNFYVSGYGKPDIKGLARKTGLQGVLNEYEPVSFNKAINIMRNSGLLLLIGWKGLSGKGWRPQKIYEYLGSGAPILLVNSPENKELAEFLLSTERGSVADETTAVKEEIIRLYNSFISNASLRADGNKGVLEEYKAINTTRKLCGLIEETT